MKTQTTSLLTALFLRAGIVQKPTKEFTLDLDQVQETTEDTPKVVPVFTLNRAQRRALAHEKAHKVIGTYKSPRKVLVTPKDGDLVTINGEPARVRVGYQHVVNPQAGKLSRREFRHIQRLARKPAPEGSALAALRAHAAKLFDAREVPDEQPV